jgi:glycosyltransferase involved in cell wall biosynthesis
MRVINSCEPSATHLVLIPSFNTGAILQTTVRDARLAWAPVWVVIDGSDDGSAERMDELAAGDDGLRIIVLPRNGGKGAALCHAMRLAAQAGFTHSLALDADGQHPCDMIPQFMAKSMQYPAAVILGVPVFGADAPSLRVGGRKISNWWTKLETGGAAIMDSLFGFRVYPLQDLLAIMERTRWMRRFDFEPEAAVKLVWRGVPTVNVPAPVRYLTPDEGGISHFRYVRDNVLLTGMHIRLMLAAIFLHLPTLLRLSGPAERPPAA